MQDLRIRGLGQLSKEAALRLPEVVPFLRYAGAGAIWTTADFFGHQLFESLAEDKTPAGYYGRKLLFSVPLLILGRMVADLTGGPLLAKAATIGTVANSLMQLRYLLIPGSQMGSSFNVTTFLLHEAILVPASLLVATDDAAIL